jgi:hypothetical protein
MFNPNPVKTAVKKKQLSLKRKHGGTHGTTTSATNSRGRGRGGGSGGSGGGGGFLLSTSVLRKKNTVFVGEDLALFTDMHVLRVIVNNVNN